MLGDWRHSSGSVLHPTDRPCLGASALSVLHTAALSHWQETMSHVMRGGGLNRMLCVWPGLSLLQALLHSKMLGLARLCGTCSLEKLWLL